MADNETEFMVGVTIHNTFTVTAKTPERAREIVRDMTNDEILNDCSFSIHYTDKIRKVV